MQGLIPVIQSECIMDPTRPKIRNYSRPQSGPKSARGLMKSLPKMEKRSTEIVVHLRKSTKQFCPQQSSSLANGVFSVPMQQKSGNKAITPAEPTACSSPAQTSRDDPLPLDPLSNSSAQSPCITTRSGRQVKRPSHLKDFF